MTETLYRRNNQGKPCIWTIQEELGRNDVIRITHGVLPNGSMIVEKIAVTMINIAAEINSRINAKRKEGYKTLSEIKDNNGLPVEGTDDVYDFLNAYLPYYRTSSNGALLPMLAKTFDNTNNKLFKENSLYFGQAKINGLRCFVSAYENKMDMFMPIRLRFQSREGTYWGTLSDLEDYLLQNLDEELLNKMLHEGYVLDGELYLPGHSVNEINHFVKDDKCRENKLLQFWCYDIAIEDTTYFRRQQLRRKYLDKHNIIYNKHDHLNNKVRLISLTDVSILNETQAISERNDLINMGFEGLIMRDVHKEYQFGKRNTSMIKFKRSTDGKFKIVDIYPEGLKRKDIPLILLKNDINDATFEVHVGGTFDYQASILKNKDTYIGKFMFVEYGERSGVNQVPFHVKHTHIMN